MVKQVEEVGIETEARPLADLEALADSKVNVCKHRARQRTPADIGVAPKAAVVIDRLIQQAIRRRSPRCAVEVLVRSVDFPTDDGVCNFARTFKFRAVRA